MRIARFVIAASALVAALASPAAAQDYPPTTEVLPEKVVQPVAEVEQPAAAQPDDGLAATGFDVTVGTALAAGLLGAGATTVAVARRRERRRT